MRSRHVLSAVAVLLCGLAVARLPAYGAEEPPQTMDEQAIRAAAQRYVDALRRNDVKALHDLWVAEGDMVDERGRARSAHKVIDDESQARVADATGEAARSTVDVVESSVRFLTPRVAIEDGRVNVSNGPEAATSLRGRFTALWVKQDGDWRLASLREVRVPTTTARDLAGLDWLVGDWTGDVGKSTFDVTARWNAKRTLLERDLTVTHDGKVVFSGEQHIGVDPLDGKIKSWMHDSDGGRGEGVWTRQGDDAWVVQAAGVSPDGRRTLATNLYTHAGPHQIIWKSTGAFSGGRARPDFEITLTRSASGDKQPSSARRAPSREE